MARRFKLDYQTFQFICLIGVPSVGIYLENDAESACELEKHLSPTTRGKYRAENNQALKEFWAKNGGVGKLTLRQKLKWIEFAWRKDEGHAPGNRINHDNIVFHEAKERSCVANFIEVK